MTTPVKPPELSEEEAVEVMQHAIHDELVTWDDGDPRSIHWRKAVAKAAYRALSRIANVTKKEGV